MSNDDDIEIIGGADPRLMAAGQDADDRSITDLVEQPAKVMRIGTMIKQLLEEVRAAPLDDASRNRLRAIHATSIRELEEGLAPELREELDRLTLPFTEGSVPSDAELRIAQAQLVGWLEGLFHGIQTALFAQQMAARSQLEQMREQRGLQARVVPVVVRARRDHADLQQPGRAVGRHQPERVVVLGRQSHGRSGEAVVPLRDLLRSGR